MLKVEYQGQFKKDYKLAVKRGCNPELLADVITMLVNEKPLMPKYKDHSLADSRNYKRMRACHIPQHPRLVRLDGGHRAGKPGV